MRTLALSAAFALVLGLLSAGLLASGPAPQAGGEGIPIPLAIFEIQGGGTIFHVDGGPTPGQKAFKTKTSSSTVADCIQGELGCSTHLADEELSDGGKAYLFVLDETIWLVGTSSDPATAVTTQLSGLMDGKGRFMFAGRHLTSGTAVFLEGKATLVKGTLVPTKLSGKLRAVSPLAQHWLVGSFKTVASLPVSN
jgi:hypothetical protein